MNEFKVDLTNCDIEPIHILGKIQSHGFLIAVNSKTHLISYISENVQLLTKDPAKYFLGLQFEVLEKEIKLRTSHAGLTITHMITIGVDGKYPDINNPLNVEIDQVPYYLIINLSGSNTILEFEPVPSDSQIDIQHTIGKSMSGILSAKNLDSMFQRTALEVKKIIDYDRVMVYQFNEEGDGKIIAEAKIDGLDPFLGLQYPASDIPKQARELYKVNLTRIIADVNSVDSSLLGLSDDQPLDLSHAGLRAVSPIHIQYLKNMGVESSFSISLISGTELWGLIVCHSYSPRFINYKAREAAKLLGEILSSALEYRQGEEDSELFLTINNKVNELIESLEREEDVSKALIKNARSLKDLNSACGVALVFDQNITTYGQTPNNEQITEIAAWLKSNMVATVYHTHRFPQIFSPAMEYSEVSSGILAYMLSRELGEFMIWFKPEQINQISWAGNPEKPVEINANGLMQLSPRQSFESWTDMVKNTSEKWNRAEITAVISLGEHTNYIVKRKVNEIKRLNELLKQSYDELNIFSYTVTHDLRTPLSAIKSYAELLMINNNSLDDQAKKVLGRINACADRMALLIKEILNYSMLGKADIKTDRIDMVDMIHTIKAEIIEGLQPENLIFEIGETPAINGDGALISQVFTNLINNAVKYSAKSQPSKVTVSGRKKGNEIIYIVTDNGIGIDDKYYNLVFELFKRMDNVKGFEGTGVGLAIVKRIMEKHNGKVWFESKLGLGTTFYLSFECLS
jgi:chemotaxis family two-component system sensor kinase Cph1